MILNHASLHTTCRNTNLVIWMLDYQDCIVYARNYVAMCGLSLQYTSDKL